MKFVIANDHAAVELKNQFVNWLTGQGHEVTDLGVAEGEKADYPDKGVECAKAYLDGDYDFGIVCCGTGIGISIAANKVKGIRCALPQNAYAASMAREHNNCKMLAFGGRIDYPDSPIEMLQAFLNASHDENSRHAGRIEKIMQAEN